MKGLDRKVQVIRNLWLILAKIGNILIYFEIETVCPGIGAFLFIQSAVRLIH